MSLYWPFQISECSVVGRYSRGLSAAPLSSSGQTSMPSIGRGDPFMVTVSAEETPTRLQSVGSDKARSAAASEGVEGKQARSRDGNAHQSATCMIALLEVPRSSGGINPPVTKAVTLVPPCHLDAQTIVLNSWLHKDKDFVPSKQ